MKASTATVISAFAVALMIQPCPAPPVVVGIVAAAAAVNTAVDAAGATVGAVAAGAVSGAVAGVVSKHAKRDGVSDICMVDFINAGHSQLEQMTDGSVMVHGVPSSCMKNLEEWNGHPEIETLNSMFGYAEQMNDTTSITMYQMPSDIHSNFQGMMGTGSLVQAEGQRFARVKARTQTRTFFAAG